MVCDVCGKPGKITVLEEDGVSDRRYKRRTRYRTLLICEDCLKDWRLTKEEKAS